MRNLNNETIKALNSLKSISTERVEIDELRLYFTDNGKLERLICSGYYKEYFDIVRLPGGYSGGHTSQSHWGTDLGEREARRLMDQGILAIDWDTEGNTSGYYPAVGILKSEYAKKFILLSHKAIVE